LSDENILEQNNVPNNLFYTT